MINDPKDIQEVLNVIDNVTKEQLDEAIRSVDEMSEQEIIEKVMHHVKYIENAIAEPGSTAEALFGLWELYNREKEKNKKLEEEREWFKRSYEIVMEEKANDYFLMSKVIDLMAEDISMDNCLKVMEGACKRIKDCYQEMEGNISCEQCAKEYYFKKARGEGNE